MWVYNRRPASHDGLLCKIFAKLLFLVPFTLLMYEYVQVTGFFAEIIVVPDPGEREMKWIKLFKLFISLMRFRLQIPMTCSTYSSSTSVNPNLCP
jgi:hypothetical protein